ncbi:3-hydroxybutyryl-CoA dehydrogenase [Marivibrio halodurans]|uniref:3-hydroxybutyryl-CoA dehydrogenase n=1 Tax=Marivibrio halodurans TaxID=2039722 RepID=A0A8J7S294_9PROT|nr:3-hydroxybutyryl-CoA dehydrogenase [Marivibrio halodurans]MBP5859022.1 3-hydroxybutyryl-CoA dehydrogenase [Marivibrio halodurans]
MFKTVGVVGAGQMGHGIAQISAAKGVAVRLMDRDEEALATGLEKIRKGLARQERRGLIGEADVGDTLARIETGTDFSILADCDMVIEAASENEEVKRDIFKKLIPHLKAEAMLASNTSSISITRLAAATDRPAQFCGCHFMNPVPAMNLVELIRGLATAEETFEAFQTYAEALDKTVAVSEDFPGFIVNRILLPMINEAIYTLYEGVGSVTAIDTAMKLGTKHPLGPLELADFIGLDTCLAILGVLHGDLADSKYRPCPLLVKYVEAGWLGVKTGRGFYDYSQDVPRPTR